MKSWDGKDNIIDSSKIEGEGQRRERDSWDAELDKGKVRREILGRERFFIFQCFVLIDI